MRRPDLAEFLQTTGVVGQVQPVQANVRFPSSIAAVVEGAEMVVNATGVRAESGPHPYHAVHVDGAAAVARAALAAGIKTYAHISGIGADPRSASPYIASKGRGEAATLEDYPDAVILRPSVVFGPEDDFFNRFGALARYMPVIPLLPAAGRVCVPVYVGDVARATVAALDGTAKPHTVYELGGPRVMTLREAAELVLRTIDRRCLLVGLPLGLSRLVASASTFASAATFGRYPKLLTTSRDQVDLLAADNIASPEAEAEGRVLRGLGIEPQAPDAIVPTYLVRFRRTGQYEAQRSA